MKRSSTTNATSARTSTPDGQVDLDIAQQGIDAVATELGVASIAAEEIYQPAQLNS
jgi:hypothetical protein